MTSESTPLSYQRRRPASRYKVKQADGAVTNCSSRVAQSGSQAHSFDIGGDRFTVFAEDELSPVTTGDRVRFDYEIRRLRSGHRNQYLSVVSETLTIYAPSELGIVIEGSIYIFSNPSMPGLLKVGYTTGTVAKRASELSGVTSVPTGFRVEWSLPVVGDPKAVEQRAHAHLAPKRHGKEFFKVSLDDAKAACVQSFAELYPDAASSMDLAFAERAEAEIQRRKALEALAAEREKEREREVVQRAFDATREGSWRKLGSCEVVLLDFRYAPNFNHPSFLSKLFGAKYQDYMMFMIEVGQHGGTIYWNLRANGRIREKSVWKVWSFPTEQECMEGLSSAMKEFAVANHRATIQIPNLLIENPPELPEDYRNPMVTLTVKSLDGLVIRPAPIQARQKRYA